MQRFVGGKPLGLSDDIPDRHVHTADGLDKVPLGMSPHPHGRKHVPPDPGGIHGVFADNQRCQHVFDDEFGGPGCCAHNTLPDPLQTRIRGNPHDQRANRRKYRCGNGKGFVYFCVQCQPFNFFNLHESISAILGLNIRLSGKSSDQGSAPQRPAPEKILFNRSTMISGSPSRRKKVSISRHCLLV